MQARPVCKSRESKVAIAYKSKGTDKQDQYCQYIVVKAEMRLHYLKGLIPANLYQRHFSLASARKAL